jgi:hypothetical protein
MDNDDRTSLTSSELMIVILSGIAAAGACVGAVLQFVVRSRCTKLSCFCRTCECDRDVVASEDAVRLDTSALQNISSVAP